MEGSGVYISCRCAASRIFSILHSPHILPYSSLPHNSTNLPHQYQSHHDSFESDTDNTTHIASHVQNRSDRWPSRLQGSLQPVPLSLDNHAVLPIRPSVPFGAFSNDIFRILDSATADLAPLSRQGRAARSFNPRFDVKEAGSAYELQGELPGFEQKDLDIEFVDERTLVIKGRHTYSNESGHPAQEAQQNTAAATEDVSDTASNHSASYRKPSVEDEYVDAGAESADAAEGKGKAPANDNAVSRSGNQETQVAEPQSKYWVSERTTGEFERRFAFPGRVNQEEVRASLKNGILSIVVPKIVEKESRRIAIE